MDRRPRSSAKMPHSGWARLGAAALGSRVSADGGRVLEVVGIVGRVPYRDLASEPLPAIYLPLAQRPLTHGVLVVRSARSPSETAALLRETVTALDSRLPAPELASLDERVSRSVARFRGAAWLLGAAAALAVLLSAIGIYGLFWSFVVQALPEIGIRMALGADRARIGAFVARTALSLAAVGFLVGAGLGSWGATYLRGFLFGVQPWDVRTLLLGVTVAAALALLTALRPAYRASCADPMIVIRCE